MSTTWKARTLHLKVSHLQGRYNTSCRTAPNKSGMFYAIQVSILQCSVFHLELGRVDRDFAKRHTHTHTCQNGLEALEGSHSSGRLYMGVSKNRGSQYGPQMVGP